MSTKKRSQRICGIILFRTDKIFKIKFGWLIPESTCSLYSGNSINCVSNEAYERRFILMTSCRTGTETVSRMEKAEPFDCCCSHQSVASPSLCLCQGSRWTFWTHFVVFSWFNECWEQWDFFNLGFDCLSPKSNLSEFNVLSYIVEDIMIGL